MTGPDFLDTNVLVYAYDTTDARKQHIAQELVRRALAGEAVVSVQVIAEFAATLLHKISPAASAEEVTALLDTLAPIRVVAPDTGTVRRAVEARHRYGVHFWDGMILASAERGGCGRVWSEDFNAGQKYFGFTVENPCRRQ